MTFWSAVVLIAAIIAVTEIVKSRHRSQSGITRDMMGNERREGTGEAEREIAELRERIKVLERIATEGNALEARDTQRIAAEIEALREKQAE